MNFIIRKLSFVFILLLLIGGFSTSKAMAASSFAALSDTITTSRPSSSAPLYADQLAGATSAQVIDVPGASTAQFLASDSAVLYSDTGQALSTVTVSSMSAQFSGPPNYRYVYFTSTPNPNNAHHKGTALFAPITATHQIKFITSQAIPGTTGQIVISFPSIGANNFASPSATTFSFNGEAAAPADTTCYNVSDSVTCGGTVAMSGNNTYTFTVGATGIPAGKTVIVNLGCTGQTSGVCTTFSSRIVNPTKSNSTAGASDTWKIYVSTTDGTNTKDSGSVRIATVEAVQVQATVEPTITFTITGGYSNGNNATSIYGSCGNIVQNSGITDTATFVDLGLVGPGQVNLALQKLSVATNGGSGYAIIATSSGRFINPSNGVWITDANGGNGLSANDSPVPAVIAAGTPDFGIHACGPRSNVNTDQWVNAGTQNGTSGTAKFSNPWNTGVGGFYATIANYSGVPVPSEDTAIVYGVAVSSTTPPGLYSNYFTYVATAIF